MPTTPLAHCGLDDLTPAELQALITEAIKTYAARVEAQSGAGVPPIDAQALTATDVVVTVSDMIRAMDLNLFDLAIWFRRPHRAFETPKPGGRHD